ncbi:MAG: hypothetical protein JNM31_15380 [Flavobacteriales bacterium]|nr:hypothetical protein [Flavobacteriales bacterium]
MRAAIPLLFCVVSSSVWCQNVGINATGAAPASSAMLDITSTSSGLLIPRMTTAQRTGIAAPATGLLVYDTNTNGFWYWNGAAWTTLFTSATGWALTGNSLTGQEVLGSLNAQPVRFVSSNVERMRLLANGQLVVNNTVPAATDAFSAYGGAYTYANAGYHQGTTGAGTLSFAQGATTFGARAHNANASGSGLLGTGNNVGGIYLTSGSGLAGTGAGLGVFGYGINLVNGTGVLGGGNNTATLFTMVAGSGLAGTGTNFGVYGMATSNAFGAANAPARAGGYFESGSGGNLVYTYVACFEGPGTPRKVMGNGTVNTVVQNGQGEHVLLSAPEAPENLFQDYGTAQLVNGRAHVTLDPTLARNILVNEAHPLRVFIQPRGACKGMYVTNETADGFDVVELDGGNSNAGFHWMVVANRANVVHADGTVWPFAEERFAVTQGPQPVAAQPVASTPIPTGPR